MMKPIHDQTLEELRLTVTILELRVVIAEFNAQKRAEQLESVGVKPFTSSTTLAPDALEMGRVYTDGANYKRWSAFGDIS